tara:strand:- start:320 stop:460 length:141 start_codon:yes stop_codon:yes gene_type:complete
MASKQTAKQCLHVIILKNKAKVANNNPLPKATNQFIFYNLIKVKFN